MLLCIQYQGNISSRFSSNFEANICFRVAGKYWRNASSVVIVDLWISKLCFTLYVGHFYLIVLRFSCDWSFTVERDSATIYLYIALTHFHNLPYTTLYRNKLSISRVGVYYSTWYLHLNTNLSVLEYMVCGNVKVLYHRFYHRFLTIVY